MAATASTAALASGRRIMKRFIVVSQKRFVVVSHSCCSDVRVWVHPHSPDPKDRIAEMCLRCDHDITLLWPPTLSRRPAPTL
jgi:hypothetical protein